MNQCKDCLFFLRFPSGNTELGECHCNAPIVLPNSGHRTGMWPIVSELNGCGDFTQKES